MEPLFWYAVFVVSVTAHEAAHALVAHLGGDSTAYRGGQVSLNPLPHMRREPIGMVVFPLLTAVTSGWPMGWASAPYDPLWEQRHPRKAAWMAAAGPGANLVLACAAFGLLRLGLEIRWFFPPDALYFSQLVAGQGAALTLAGGLLSMLLVMNLLLAILNLIPFPPLDGASALGVVLPADLVLRLRAALSTPALGLALFFGVFWLFPRVFGPLLAVTIRWLYA